MMRHAKAAGRNLLLRHGTVAAYLALLLASSTAVYAAATIGSPEVINNSLQSVDLKDGAAVGGADVINDSLKGADIQEATLSGVGRKIVWSKSATLDETKATVLTVGGYTLKANCYTSTFGGLLFSLWTKGPAGDFQAFPMESRDDLDHAMSPYGGVIPSATDTEVAGATVADSHYLRGDGSVWIHSGSTLLQLDIHYLLDKRGSTGICTLYGVATIGV
jgi:hypothetical protein